MKKPLFTFFLAMLFITNAFASVREERIEKLHAKSKPLTAESAIETARFMVAGGGREYVSYSPDATRYVVRLARGDVKRDGVWIEVLQGLVDGKGGSASAAELVARLYSSGLGAGINAGPEADSSGVANPIKWIDNRTIAFLCSNEYGIRQVVTVDLVSKKVEFRTNHRTQIRAFDISTNQDLLFYASATDPSHVPMAAPSTGYVVPDGADALSIVNGYFDGSSIFTRLWNSKWFLQLADQEIPIRIGNRQVDVGYPNRRFVTMSPDGRWAIVSAPADSIPVEWDRYAQGDTVFETYFRATLRQARSDLQGLSARNISQLYLVDVGRRTAASIWNAPESSGTNAWWSRNSEYVLLSPVKIPSAENATSGGDEVAVLNPSTGKYWKLDLDGGGVREVSWAESNKLDIYTETERRPRGKRFALESNVWREVGPASSRLSDERNRIAVHQDINSPPILALTSNSNRRLRTLLDPNPRLATEYRLGRVRFLEGNLSTGERWTASLTLPTNYILGRRYPMVIQVQARPVREDEFSLYGRATDGNGLGPSDIAPYAAQILAGRDIATLQLGVDARFGTPLEVEPFVRAFQEVSDSLVAQGLVRRDRVGLSGFSRMGYYVVKALVKSNAQFAAAISTDNFDPGYVQTLLANTYADAEQAIGAPPFGDGLRTWLEQSIGFNVEKIQTPLLLIGQSGSTRENVLWQWEIVGRLRQLKRPIEMYLMPDIDAHPSHSMQNPRQILAVQGRAVDWFDFWLNDRESSDPTKQQQYSQWRRLRSAVAGARDHSE